MEVIQLATPAHFTHGRVERIGLLGNQLFVAFRDDRNLEVWSVHYLVPCSWSRLFRHSFHDLFYAHCAVSEEQNAVFVLVAAFFLTQGRDGGICILGFDLDTQQLEEFTLDTDFEAKFEEVTLERVGLGCGRKRCELFLHDRTMVTGQIPFWRISLDRERMTFTIRALPILDNQQVCAQCTRFPVVLNGDDRCVLRITNDYQVFVYNGDTECWIQLTADSQTGLDLSSFTVRGISETFGHNWHRFSAIESKLSIFADADCCIFKVFQKGTHHFFRFTISIERNSYNLKPCSRAKLDKRLDTLCFVHCSEMKMVFVNKHLVGFVPTQPPLLREICFWALQKQFATKKISMGTKIWTGGRTADEIRTMFNINPKLQIV